MTTKPMAIENFPKRCSCGRTHTAAQWARLPLVGNGGDEVEALELRNCPCGSTIAVILWSYDPAICAMYADTIPAPANEEAMR